MTSLFILFLVFLISLLILVHEWGHFFSARVLGVRVDEFGFGFPPRIFSRVKNGIRYSFNLLPFGGFVRIFGEHGEGEVSHESFASRPVWQRFVILAAGVFMNLVLAWVLFSASAGIGVPQVVDPEGSNAPVSVLSVAPDSPAAQAGITFGDQITKVSADGMSLAVETEEDVISFVDLHKGSVLTLSILHGAEARDVEIASRKDPPPGEGAIGISMGRLEIENIPWYQAPIEGARTLFRAVWITLYGFWFIVSELIAGERAVPVSGPIGIFSFANDIRPLGAAFFLHFMGILSVNLAVLNFLPIPALDGGRAAFLIYEKIRRKRINPIVENYAHFAGFALLILLMILVTYRDIRVFF